MAIVSGYLVLSLPFSIVSIVRPHAVGPRLLLLIFDTVIITSLTIYLYIYISSFNSPSRSSLNLTWKCLYFVRTFQVALTLNTSAAAAAAAIVYLAHNGNSNTNWLAICQQFGDFCQEVSGAVVASFISVVVFMFLILLSALAIRKPWEDQWPPASSSFSNKSSVVLLFIKLFNWMFLSTTPCCVRLYHVCQVL